MNSVTAQAAELKLALEQLYKQAEEADAPDKKKPKYSYEPNKPKPAGGPPKAAPKGYGGPDDELLSGSRWATAGDVLGLPYSDARAGKATTLSKAMGNSPAFNITNPNTARVLTSLLGAAGGATIGGFANGPRGAMLGTGIGATLGALGNNAARASQIATIRDEYNKAKAEGQTMDLAAADPHLSRWGALLPAGGFHRAGSVDALEQLAGRSPRYQEGNVGRTTGAVGELFGRMGQGVGMLGAAGVAEPMAAASLAGGLGAGSGAGALISLLGGGFEGYDAAVRNQRLRSQLEKGASDDLKDYDDLTDDVPNEFKGAHGEMRKFISDNNKKKGKKVNKSAAFAARLGHQNGTMHKRAFLESLKGMGAQALDAYKGLDPTAQAAILGGGAGAAIGGVGNAMFGKRKKGVGILGRLGRGALAGGAIGGLGGAGVNEMAIRKGMGNTGVDRSTYLSPSTSAGEGKRLPASMANDLLGGLMESSTVSKPNMQIVDEYPDYSKD